MRALLTLNELPQFDLIQTLRGHHSEIWSLALSHFGDFVVTGGGDRGIRVWERTEDPVSLHALVIRHSVI